MDAGECGHGCERAGMGVCGRVSGWAWVCACG